MSVFLQTLHHSSVSWEMTLLYFFSWNCTWFGQKEPIKVQDFRLLPTHFFDFWLPLLKDIKFFSKKVQRSYVSLPWRLMRNLKKNWSVVSKMTRIWEILTRALKSLKNLHFHWFLLWKVFIVWPKKVQRSYLSWHFHDMKSDVKLEEKLTWGLKNFGKWHEEYAKFSQEHLKSQNWDFDGIL